MLTNLFIAMVVAGLFALWILDRRRFARRIQSLSQQQRESETVLSAFMEESEKISRQLSRLISLNRLTAVNSSKDQQDLTYTRRDPEFVQPKNNGVGKRHLVLSLAQRGRSVPQIAERLMMPVGEIELILNLNRTTRAARTA